MPLADKIIELRKKQGWSQIDLAERLDVSRQSVSKWEMAQAVPELDKIIRMSELFAVTTDYLLKDDAPVPDGAPPSPPEEPSRPAPEPEKGAPPAAPKKHKKIWPWVLASCLLGALAVGGLLMAAGVLSYQRMPVSTPPVIMDVPPSPTPEPTPASGTADEAVMEQPAAASLEQTAVADPDAPEAGMTEFAYEGGAMTAGGIDPEALEAAIAEYAPYGITYEDGRWCLDGQPIRVFTDVLTSNGESLGSGHFHGTIRNFAGGGDIDVRTVRDYEHCDEQGHGALLYVESCDIHLDSVHWEEHHAEPHEEEHHEEAHHTAAGTEAPAVRLAEAAVQADGKTVLRYTLTYENSGDALPSQMRMHALDGSVPDTLTYYEYDDAGRMILRRYELEGQDTSTERWTYDDAGRLIRYEETIYLSADGPDAWVTTYEYDGEGRLAAARENHNGTDAYVTEYEYSPAPYLGSGTLPSAWVRYELKSGEKSGSAVEETHCTYQNDFPDTEEYFTDGVLRRSTEYTYPMGYGYFTVRAEEHTYDENGPTDRTVRLIRRDGAGQDVLAFTLPGTEDLAYDETGCLLHAAAGGRAMEFTYE